MTSIIGERIQEQYDSSSIKSYKGKIMSGARERATKKYFKDVAARERRKQSKTNYETFRRDEQPDEEDEQLEDIHFANFLGLKALFYDLPYNDKHIDTPVNINECDILLPYEYETAIYEEESHREEENFEAMVAYMSKQVELAQQMISDELYICDCKEYCYNSFTADRYDISDEMSDELSLGSEEDDDVNQNLEWVEDLVKRQYASYLEAMKAIEHEEAGIEWEDEEPYNV